MPPCASVLEKENLRKESKKHIAKTAEAAFGEIKKHILALSRFPEEGKA